MVNKGQFAERDKIIHRAQSLISGARSSVYGPALLNHERIAAIWSVLLEKKITPQEVALCMVGVKLARLAETQDHDDSYADLIGYAALAHEFGISSKRNQQ